MRRIFARSAYNYDPKVASAECAVVVLEDESKTQQQFKEECDINTIIKRFGLGVALPTTFKAPMIGDFSGVEDFQTAMNAVKEAETAFMQMPAALRKRFDHDPQQLLGFLDHDGNREEAMKLGLIPRPAEKTRDVVTAVDELAARIVPRETK